MENTTPTNPIQPQENAPYAVASLVLGILSLVIGCIGVGLVLGIIGLVLGSKGTKAYNEQPSRYKGEGMLKAGKIMSIIGIVFGAIAIIAIIVSGAGILALFEWFDVFEDLF